MCSLLTLLLACHAAAAFAAEPPRVAVRDRKAAGLLAVREIPIDYRFAKAQAYAWLAETYRYYNEPTRSMDSFVRLNLEHIIGLQETLESQYRRKYLLIGEKLGEVRPRGIPKEVLEGRAAFAFETVAAYMWGNMFPTVVKATFEDPELDWKGPPLPPQIGSDATLERNRPLNIELLDMICEAAPLFELDGNRYCDDGEPLPESLPSLPVIQSLIAPPLRQLESEAGGPTTP